MTAKCTYCQTEFELSRAWHVYCSTRCRFKAWQGRQ